MGNLIVSKLPRKVHVS